MKVAILTLGTRGDVQPYLALARAFKAHGHEVTISTGKNFESLVKTAGVNFWPVEADFHKFLHSDAGKKTIKLNPRARAQLKRWVYPMIYNALDRFYQLATQSDKVLFNVKTLADHFADQFPEKMVQANVVPTLHPTNEFVNPAFKSFLLPSFLNRLSYKLYEMSISKTMQSQIAQFRKDRGLPQKYQKPDMLSIYGISPHLLEKPRDFPAESYFTGFWTADTSESLDAETQAFLDAGEPPLLITFGSMPFDSTMDLGRVIKKLSETLHIRILLVKGWGMPTIPTIEGVPEILIIRSAPFERLFPRVRAVVHHGGAGTTATCLLAGVPFLACPVLYPLGDQDFWGTVAYEKGVALKPVPLRKISEKQLLDKCRELLKTPRLYENSQSMKRKLSKEDGAFTAVRLVEESAAPASLMADSEAFA